MTQDFNVIKEDKICRREPSFILLLVTHQVTAGPCYNKNSLLRIQFSGTTPSWQVPGFEFIFPVTTKNAFKFLLIKSKSCGMGAQFSGAMLAWQVRGPEFDSQ